MSNQKKITNAVEDYKAKMKVLSSGEKGAYFAFAITEDGATGLTFGGRVDLAGSMFSSTLAHLVYQTPGIGEEYIDLVFDVAKRAYHELQEGFGGVQ